MQNLNLDTQDLHYQQMIFSETEAWEVLGIEGNVSDSQGKIIFSIVLLNVVHNIPTSKYNPKGKSPQTSL